jgi:long-chain fatty acid transport protein
MKKFIKQVSACIVCLGVMSPVFATNGYFSHGYGTKNKALAGAGVALPQDAMIAATNPAGMVWVGERLDVGLAIFSPSPRSYTSKGDLGVPDGTPCVPPGFPDGCPFQIGPQSLESENDYFFIPSFAYNWMLSPQSSAGVTVYGNGGMNTEWVGGTAQHDDGSNFPLPGSTTTTPGTYGAGTAGVNLEQLFINASYARKFAADKASWGLSLIFAYQRFEAQGLGTFAGYSTDPTNLTNNGVDDSTGFGAKLGIQGEVTSGLTVAASYQTEMEMSEFDKYKGLFAEQGGFNIPATWALGLTYAFANNSKIVFDVQQIMYSDIASVGNPMFPALGQCAQGVVASCLGGSNGPGFGWEDMTVYKIGYQWMAGQGWTWRAGYSAGDQPIPNSEVLFNILAPGIMEDHLTFGFTKDLQNNSEFNFGFMYALKNSIEGPNPLTGNVQQIELEMTQYELEASYSKKF